MLFVSLKKIEVPIYDKSGRGRDYNVKTTVIVGYKDLENFKKLFKQFSFGRTREQCGIKLPTLILEDIFIKKSDKLIETQKQILS